MRMASNRLRLNEWRIMWSQVKARSKSGWNHEARMHEVMMRCIIFELSSAIFNLCFGEKVCPDGFFEVSDTGYVLFTAPTQHGRGLCSPFCVLPLVVYAETV